ncbi:MAG: RNA 2',3'-cyclic phosphodiesterase [Actinomycetota bacterium]|nr:RNA 2',3'-cyclic phosphodiesterase [Actinomycetota bacterium]
MRIFVGIDLPEQWRAALAAGAEAIRQAEPGWETEKWVLPENLHVTLKFMGDVPDESVEFLGPDLVRALERVPRFTMPLHRALLPSPDSRKVSMLWTTLKDPEGAAAGLVSCIEDVAADYGVVPSSRHFHPHITLVRTRTTRGIKSAEEAARIIESTLPSDLTMSVPAVTVYKSALTKYRPVYERLAIVDLSD